MSRRTGGKNGDDHALWQMVAKTIRPLHRPKSPAKRAPSPKPSPVKIKHAPFPASAPARTQPPGTGFDAATRERLKKGKLAIEARLDLHGMTQVEAHAALRRFIGRACASEARTLLVITGKGRGGGGVLRRLVPLWLQESDMAHIVLATEPARAKDGGEGALYVRLRNPKKK